MPRIRIALSLMLFATLVAGSLHADRITYLSGTGAAAKLEVADRATITAWSAAKVDFETDAKQRVSVKYSEIISLDRTGGTMSKEFSAALDMIGSDQTAAIAELAKLSEAGNALDREEALYIRAQLLEADSIARPAARATAISAYQTYVQRHKAGYFARDVYTRLARLQNENDGRATLRALAGADASLRRFGNQKLGEHEAYFGKFPAAITAFQAAASAAKDDRDRNNEVLAQAWEAWCQIKNGNAANATTTLVAITSDDKFDDANSSDDEIALAIAFNALGDAYFASGNFEKGYDAYVKGAYYAWWIGGTTEGQCIARAYVCAKKLDGTDPKWRKRRDKLRTALVVGFPARLLQEADKE
jgi:tetratricopeptide (TPR) repeat protein